MTDNDASGDLAAQGNPTAGLCASCSFHRTIRGVRSAFVMCERSKSDPSFARYPRLPVTTCPGYAHWSPNEQASRVASPDQRLRTVVSWSSGKDSAFTLATLRREQQFNVVGLLTTVNSAANRVAMHAVRQELLEAQARALALPLLRVDLPSPCSNEQYEDAMRNAISVLVTDGVTQLAFGDLFLEDVRRYREERLQGAGITPIYPVWMRDTRQLAHEVLASGVRAVVTCVDPAQIPASFAGRDFDATFLSELPASCDPCGENGEFHTFVCDGPGFSHPLHVERGITIERDGFIFTDLLLA